MAIRYRTMPDGSLIAPRRGKEPPCPAGYVRDRGNPYHFYSTKGLGDTVASLIDRISGGRVKPCNGCDQRKDFLNRILPYESKALYQELYEDSKLSYGQSSRDRCPGTRYYSKYRDHLRSPIIDLGCGTGDTVRLMRDDIHEADGIDQIDLDNGMQVGSIIETLDLSKYLTSVCIDVFEHLYDDELKVLLANMQQTTYQVITVCTCQSREQGYGIDLHVNIKTVSEWEIFINEYLDVIKIITLEPTRILYLCERANNAKDT